MDSIKERKFEPGVKLEDIEIDPLNSRKESIRAGLEELKASIKKVGLIHPVLLIEGRGPKKFKLIVGQRRFCAFEDLGYPTIPAIVINNVDDTTKRLISFSENITRNNLPYNDTIKMCDELYKAYSHYPKGQRLEKIAKEVGVSLNTIVRYLSYRIVPEKVRDLVEAKKLDRSQAYKLTSTFWPNTKKIEKIANYIVNMTKPEWESVFDAGAEMPKDTSVEEILEESKKPSRMIPVKIKIERVYFEKLKDITCKSETKITISDFIGDIIKEYLKGQ